MAGGIESGMAFGSYSKSVEALKEQYSVFPHTDLITNKKLESSFVFCEKGSRRVMANAYREDIEYNNNAPLYSDAILFKDDLMYGTESKDKAGLDVFDFIQAKDKYAVDLNGNGTVEDNEIFSGKLNRTAYKEAKDNNELNKYREYLEKYNKTHSNKHSWIY